MKSCLLGDDASVGEIFSEIWLCFLRTSEKKRNFAIS